MADELRSTPNCAASRRTRPDAACTSSPPAGGPTCWWWARAAATRTTGPSSATTRERCWRTRRARSRSRRLNLPLVPAPSKRSGSASTDRFTANGRSRWPGDWPPSDAPSYPPSKPSRSPVYARDPWNVKGEVEEHVEAARQRVAALGHLEPEAGVGDPVHELARYGQSVDLLVIGGHDYRPIDHLLEQRGYLSISGCLGHAASRPRGSVATAPSRCMRGLLAALRTRRGVPLLPSAATGARSRERAEPALRRYPLSEQSTAQRLADEVSTPLLVLPAAEAS